MKLLPILMVVCGIARQAGGAEPLAIRVQAERSAKGVLLRWNTTPGRSYTVEFSSSLSGPWERMITLPATGEGLEYEFEFTPVPGAWRFFRIGTSIAEDLKAVAALPVELGKALQDSGSLGATAVFGASTLGAGGQRLVTEGTLTEQVNGWTYASDPAGRLEVHFRSGSNMTFYIDRMEGNFSGDASAFLQDPHVFNYRTVVNGFYDLTFTTEMFPNSCSFTAGVVGTFEREGVTYTCDLSQTGIYCVDNSVSGFFSLLNDQTTTGTVSAPGFDLDLQHRWRSELITSNSSTASSDENWNDSTLKLGADTYQWVNTKIQKSFKDGRPSNADTNWDYWQAQGAVLKNGEAYGVYQRVFKPAFIQFLLVLPFGTVELESWHIF